MKRLIALLAPVLLGASAMAETVPETRPVPVVEEDAVSGVFDGRPPVRDNAIPRARWDYRSDGWLWTRVALSAVQSHGRPLIDTVPRDIDAWCPAYRDNDDETRAAFWAGLLSALSRYESTYDPRAVGGGGRWFGLLQIYPQTAEYRDCRVQTGEGLKSASANLNCAVRIMSVTVPRDQAIALRDTRWRGVAADWGPMRSPRMQQDMKRYTSRQTYCRLLADVRPTPRPERDVN